MGPLVLLDLRRLTEVQRRIVALGAGALLLLMAVWVASQAAADLPAAERGDSWTRFTLAALVVAPLMGTFVWRRLSDQDVADRNIGLRRYFFLFLGLGMLFRRQLGNNPEAIALFAGASVGYVGSTMFVYGYDLVTNRLSRGRSWHYPGDPTQSIRHSSKTRSPT